MWWTKCPPVPAGTVIVALLLGRAEAVGQMPPGGGKGSVVKGVKGPPDEQTAIVREIEEAYKAPFEVDQDVLKVLRKSYEQPSADRETKIFKEIRRLYQTTPALEQAILQEIRRAYQQPTAEQESRVFAAIRQAERLPLGAVSVHNQAEQAAQLFGKLDGDRDGRLGGDELPDALRAEFGRWDANRDGAIEPDEYRAYYQSRLRWVYDQVASGQISIKLPRGLTDPSGPGSEPGKLAPGRSSASGPPAGDDGRPVVYRPGRLPAGLPDWFTRYDADGDAQVGLYEWRKAGRLADEFARLDRNGDGFVTAEEVLAFLAQQPADRPGGPPRSDAGRSSKDVMGKKKP